MKVDTLSWIDISVSEFCLNIALIKGICSTGHETDCKPELFFFLHPLLLFRWKKNKISENGKKSISTSFWVHKQLNAARNTQQCCFRRGMVGCRFQVSVLCWHVYLYVVIYNFLLLTFFPLFAIYFIFVCLLYLLTQFVI